MSAILFVCATPALAKTEPVIVTAPSDEERLTRVVSYRDLDLALARDQLRLDRRVDGAIKDVCRLRESYSERTLGAHAPYRACSNEAWTRARAAMGAAIALAQAEPGASVIATAARAISVSARAGH